MNKRVPCRNGWRGNENWTCLSDRVPKEGELLQQVTYIHKTCRSSNSSMFHLWTYTSQSFTRSPGLSSIPYLLLFFDDFNQRWISTHTHIAYFIKHTFLGLKDWHRSNMTLFKNAVQESKFLVDTILMLLMSD